MNQKELSELRRELLDHGYSRGYARRLLEELEDHCACIDEEATKSLPRKTRWTGGSRMGNVSQIVKAVKSVDELVPLARRFPIMAFVLVPAMLLLLGHVLLLLAANSLSQTRPHASDVLNNHLAVLVQWSVFVFPVVVTAITSLAAMRYRIGWGFPLMSAAVMGFSSLFCIQAGYCTDSGSIICYQSWSMDPIKLALTFAPAIVCFLMFNGSSVHSSDQSPSLLN